MMVGYKPERLDRTHRNIGVSERRGARRFSVGWSVTVKGIDSTGEAFDESGELLNLSSSGAYLYMARPLAIGSKIDVRIKLPFQKENWMKYQAEVVRVEGDHPKAGIGMRFCAVWPTFNSR